MQNKIYRKGKTHKYVEFAVERRSHILNKLLSLRRRRCITNRSINRKTFLFPLV